MELSSPPPMVSLHEQLEQPTESESTPEEAGESVAADLGVEFVAALADASQEAPPVEAGPAVVELELELELARPEPVVVRPPAEQNA